MRTVEVAIIQSMLQILDRSDVVTTYASRSAEGKSTLLSLYVPFILLPIDSCAACRAGDAYRDTPDIESRNPARRRPLMEVSVSLQPMSPTKVIDRTLHNVNVSSDQ